MIRGILDAIAGVVQHACESERHGVSLFVLGDESDQRAPDVISPTQVRWRLLAVALRRKTGRLFDLQICCRLFAVAFGLKFILNVLPFVERTQAGALDRTDVYEYVPAATTLWLNEPVTLRWIEPLHRARSHAALLDKRRNMVRNYWPTA